LLQKVVPGQLGMPLYCPKLETLRVAGVDGAAVRKFVAVRKAAGAAVSELLMSDRDRDDMDEKDERWLRANVSTFDFFEPSDSEEEEMVVDEEDMDDGP